MVEFCKVCFRKHETNAMTVANSDMVLRECPDMPEGVLFSWLQPPRQIIPPGTRLTDLFPDGLTFDFTGNLIA